MADEKNQIEVKLKEQVFETIRRIYELRNAQSKFTPVQDKIQYAGAVYGYEEVVNMVGAIFDGWFGAGKYVSRFEAGLSKVLSTKRSLMVNSGSSASLLATTALMANSNESKSILKPGDEVITPATTFPTTLNPIIQSGLSPVLMDVKIGTYNIDPNDLAMACTEKTRALVLPHTLGNPMDMRPILDFAKEHDLFFIEDACDALGSTYEGKYVGTFGDFGTFSFYPAHHITTGEGGAVVTNNEALFRTALSIRDWGRACVNPVCNPLTCGDSECPKSFRYSGKSIYADLPEDYDKRYTFSNIGFNLKPIEIQAAMGLAQLEKLPAFIQARKNNFKTLCSELQKYDRYFHFPESLPKSDPCWFAFPLTIRQGAPFKRKDFITFFTRRNIEAKLMFSGNILRQPAYQGKLFKVVGSLKNSDAILRDSFFLGVYPGLTAEKIAFMVESFKDFISNYGKP